MLKTQLCRSGPDPAAEGDLVIVQERYDRLTFLTLKRDAHLHNRYGRFAHNDLIGRPLGVRWNSVGENNENSAGFLYAFAPTSELWALAVENRTQVVYPHDAAIITLHLELTPGKVMIEAGTGSAAATTVFARALGPHGKVLSFEFHKERAAAAMQDMRLLGLNEVVTVFPEVNVLTSGFHQVEDASVDAVFLDLPAPYEMLEESARVLRANGSLCAFSPCIEQVKKTCEKLRNGPFYLIKVMTCPVRTYETKEERTIESRFEELFPSEGDIFRNSKNEEGTSTDPLQGSIARRTQTSVKDGHQGKIFKTRKPLRSRPFSVMKGHTSYLTFAYRA